MLARAVRCFLIRLPANRNRKPRLRQIIQVSPNHMEQPLSKRWFLFPVVFILLSITVSVFTCHMALVEHWYNGIYCEVRRGRRRRVVSTARPSRRRAASLPLPSTRALTDRSPDATPFARRRGTRQTRRSSVDRRARRFVVDRTVAAARRPCCPSACNVM